VFFEGEKRVDKENKPKKPFTGSVLGKLESASKKTKGRNHKLGTLEEKVESVVKIPLPRNGKRSL